MAARSKKKGSSKKRASKRLSTSEAAKVSRVANRAVKALSGKSATKAEREAMVKVAQELKKRPHANFSKEAVALWEAKVNFAVANGDTLSLTQLLSSGSSSAALAKIQETAFWDTNGGCSCGGGGGGTASSLTSSASAAAAMGRGRGRRG